MAGDTWHRELLDGADFEVLKLRTSGLREGTSTTLDLIDAETNQAKVLTERAQAANEYVQALAQLLESAGLSDRFSDSTRAYQGLDGRINPSDLAAIEKLVVGETRPDLTFLLDLPAAEGLKRAQMRRGDAQVDPFEQQAVSYHVALRGQFRMMAQSEPERWVVIDATQTADAIEQEIWTVLSQRVKARKGLL